MQDEKQPESEKPAILSVDRRDSKSKTILGIVVLVVIALVVTLIIILTRKEDYNEDYFVSDDYKLVVAMDKSIASYEKGDLEPDITYILYYYSGDDVNSVKVFFAYDSEEEAKEMDEKISLESKEWATSKKASGKYLVFDMAQDQFEGTTVSHIRDLIEDMKTAGTMYEPDKDIQDDVIDNADTNK